MEKKVFNIVNDRLSVYSNTNVFWWALVWNRRLIRLGCLLKKEKKLKNDKKGQASQFFTKTTKFLPKLIAKILVFLLFKLFGPGS